MTEFEISKSRLTPVDLWDDEKSAEAYKARSYQQVLAKLSTVIDGTPTVETYETAVSYPRV